MPAGSDHHKILVLVTIYLTAAPPGNFFRRVISSGYAASRYRRAAIYDSAKQGIPFASTAEGLFLTAPDSERSPSASENS